MVGVAGRGWLMRTGGRMLFCVRAGVVPAGRVRRVLVGGFGRGSRCWLPVAFGGGLPGDGSGSFGGFPAIRVCGSSLGQVWDMARGGGRGMALVGSGRGGGVRERGRLPPREGRMLFVCGPVSSPSGVGGGFWLVGLGGVPGGLSPVAFESAAGVGAGWVAFGDGSFGCWVRFVPFSAGRFWGVAPGVGRRFVGLVGRVLGRGVALLVFEFAPGAGVVSSSWLGGGEVVFDMRVRADDGAVVVSAGRMRRSRCWLRVAFGGAAGVESGGGGSLAAAVFSGCGCGSLLPGGAVLGVCGMIRWRRFSFLHLIEAVAGLPVVTAGGPIFCQEGGRFVCGGAKHGLPPPRSAGPAGPGGQRRQR